MSPVSSRLYALFTGLAVALCCGGLARAEKLTENGLPNLHRVSPQLYRSAQPSSEGLRAAAEHLGVKTVINLRAFHSDKDEAKKAGGVPLKLERIRIKTWDLEEEHVVQFLKLVSNTNSGPFLLHCMHGADRTGTMIAVYRMAIEGWSREAAMKEMMGPDYGYHKMWLNLPRYLRKVDVADLRRKAGLPPLPPERAEVLASKP